MVKKITKLPRLFAGRGTVLAVCAIYREVYGIVLKKILNRRYKSREIYDFKMILDLQDKGISRALWLFGRRELDHKWILEKTLQPGLCMLDIGANIGYYLLLESKLLGETGSLIAIEPSPENVKLLKKNLELNSVPNVTVIEGAVSNYQGSATFWLAAESNLNTFHKEFLEEKTGSVREIEVRVFSAEKLLMEKSTPQIDYIRMDIEGHEVEVLGSIANAVEAGVSRPAIIFETHSRAYSDDHDIRGPLNRLFACGYVAEYIGSSGEVGTSILEKAGSPAIHRLRTDDVYRTIHHEVSKDLLINCLTKTGGIRTVFLRG